MNKSDIIYERWGGFSDGSDLKSELKANDFISPKQKLEKLKKSDMTTTPSNESNEVLVSPHQPIRQIYNFMSSVK